MDGILSNMEDLIKQGLADISIQIQTLKWEQNKNGNNKDIYNICHQKVEQLHKQKQVFEDIINLLYDLRDTYEYL